MHRQTNKLLSIFVLKIQYRHYTKFGIVKDENFNYYVKLIKLYRTFRDKVFFRNQIFISAIYFPNV